MRSFIYTVLFGMALYSCNSSGNKADVLPANASYLLAGDSIKTWKLAKRFNNSHRMNMGDCFLSYRISYRTDLTMYDNNGDFPDCGESLKARWSVITNANGAFIKISGQQLPKLFNSSEEYKYFQIDALSEDTLVLRFEHAQFSDKKSILVDHFVPEDAVVEHRDFHY